MRGALETRWESSLYLHLSITSVTELFLSGLFSEGCDQQPNEVQYCLYFLDIVLFQTTLSVYKGTVFSPCSGILCHSYLLPWRPGGTSLEKFGLHHCVRWLLITNKWELEEV